METPWLIQPSMPCAWGSGLLLAALAVALVLAFRSCRTHRRIRLRSRKDLEDRLELLMRQGSDILFLLDPEGKILDANDRAVDTYGIPARAMQGRPIRSFRVAGEQPRFEAAFRAVKEGRPTQYETIHQGAAGTPFPVEVNLRPVVLGDAPYLAAFLRDISDQKRKSAGLLRLNLLYATLSQINQAILTCSNPGELLSRVAQTLVDAGSFRRAWIGLGEGGLEASATAGATAPGTGDLALAGRTLTEGRTVIANLLDAPGSSPGETAIVPILLGARHLGRMVLHAAESGFFGPEEVQLLDQAARDVAFALHHLEAEAERGRAEAALRKNEQFLIQAQEIGLVGIYEFDFPNDRWNSSPFLDQLLGISRDYPRTTEGWLALVEPGHREAMRAYLQRLLQERTPFDREYPILRHADKSLRWLHGRGEILPGGPGTTTRMIGVIQDITGRVRAEQERRDLESRLHQVQQLESLGILAGGIAHDMNNVLAAVLALASIQAETAAPDSPLAAAMGTIIKACHRGRDVVKGILFFARRNPEHSSDVSLNAVAQDISQLLSYTTLKRVNLLMELDPELPTIRADGVALAHAVMNLCVNAVDAMPGGGTLLIRTGPGKEGGVELEVRDSGEGMPPEVLQRAREPFYTTKPPGKGTGMGLAIVHGTMQVHEGELRITSRPGSGTQAVLWFPESRMVRILPPPSPSSRPGPLPAGRSLEVLLVEDDPIVQTTTCRILATLGHNVETASNGLEALDWLHQGGRADVIILDMNMPVLNGAQTLPRIMDLRPEQHVIIVTGFMDHETSTILQDYPSVRSLEKPFSVRDLEARLADLSQASTDLS